MTRRIREDAAAARVGVESETLARWRRRGLGPPHFKLPSGAVRYDVAEIEAWLRERRVPGARGPRGNVELEI